MIFLFFNGGQATCGIDLVPVVAGSNITLTPVAAGSLTLLFRLANSVRCSDSLPCSSSLACSDVSVALTPVVVC